MYSNTVPLALWAITPRNELPVVLVDEVIYHLWYIAWGREFGAEPRGWSPDPPPPSRTCPQGSLQASTWALDVSMDHHGDRLPGQQPGHTKCKPQWPICVHKAALTGICRDLGIAGGGGGIRLSGAGGSNTQAFHSGCSQNKNKGRVYNVYPR